jgi:hypothetical protein
MLGSFLLMGEPREIKGVTKEEMTTFSLPPIERGAVVWLDETSGARPR